MEPVCAPLMAHPQAESSARCHCTFGTGNNSRQLSYLTVRCCRQLEIIRGSCHTSLCAVAANCWLGQLMAGSGSINPPRATKTSAHVMTIEPVPLIPAEPRFGGSVVMTSCDDVQLKDKNLRKFWSNFQIKIYLLLETQYAEFGDAKNKNVNSNIEQRKR